MEPTTQALLKERLEKMLTLMGFSFEIETKEDPSKKEILFCVHVAEDQHYLIGRQGGNLEALQQLIRSMQYKMQDGFRYALDVNHYLEGRKRQLRERVSQLVAEAAPEQEEIQLWPMSPFERKVVHELFLGDERFQTESVGHGSDRRITIKKIQ